MNPNEPEDPQSLDVKDCGGPTPTGTVSNTWILPNLPGPLTPLTETYRHCPTCTCGQHQYVPYNPYTPYTPLYPQQPWMPLWDVY